MNVYERESVEFLGAIVVKGDVVVMTGVSFAVTGLNNRPTSDAWVPATILDGRTGFIVEGHDIGAYMVWVRVVDDPEDVVKKIGTFRVI